MWDRGKWSMADKRRCMGFGKPPRKALWNPLRSQTHALIIPGCLPGTNVVKNPNTCHNELVVHALSPLSLTVNKHCLNQVQIEAGTELFWSLLASGEERNAVSSQTYWCTSSCQWQLEFHTSSAGFSKDGSMPLVFRGHATESTCPLKPHCDTISLCLCSVSSASRARKWWLHLPPPALQRPADSRQCHRVPMCRRLHVEGRLQIPDLQGWWVEASHGGQLSSQWRWVYMWNGVLPGSCFFPSFWGMVHTFSRAPLAVLSPLASLSLVFHVFVDVIGLLVHVTFHSTEPLRSSVSLLRHLPDYVKFFWCQDSCLPSQMLMTLGCVLSASTVSNEHNANTFSSVSSIPFFSWVESDSFVMEL